MFVDEGLKRGGCPIEMIVVAGKFLLE